MGRGGCSALIRVLFLVAAASARLCFAVAPPLTWSLGIASEDKHKHRLLNDDDYPTVRITTVGITQRSYQDFIAELREHLRSDEESHGIPLTRRQTSVTIQTRFVLAELSNWAGQSVTLALDVTDAYVVGYRAGNHSVFLRPDRPDVDEAIEHLFTHTERVMLTFTGSYDALTRASGVGMEREEVELGAGALEESISAMHRYARQPSHQLQTPLVRAFFVTIQMVSEASRFRYIQHDFSQRILYSRNTPPDPSVTTLENSWGRLSGAIRNSGEGGVFESPVQLQRRNYELFYVDNVSILIAILGLLSNANSQQSSSSPPPPLALALIRFVVTPTTKSQDPTATANIVEPTVQIVGPDGMCVDVKDGLYNNGNPIILRPCRSSNNENQLWTFKADRTLRSKGKCLAAYANTPGSYIMIYDCNPQNDAFTWQVWDNGTIISDGGVALSAPASASGTELRAQDNSYTVGQGWRPTNNTEPLVAPIVGLFGLCLQGNGRGDLLLQPCALGSPEQQWALYPDGSIRPQQTRSSCLTAPPGGRGADAPVTISPCDLNSALQRWEFTNDGTIATLRDKLVLEAKGYSSPFLSKIIVNGYTGGPSQMWQALLLL
ncbi:hypothetical protein E2562_021534 [Oryza meyeriana var. granulata]|uniref:Ribosome-inactivating protein n=1 Tax=Oryza meyeriana var. granulata TaxID=110450 RepID=A0A6G1DZP4_9ORYZ|nr:hypothetical protein E2562_021534 [Oryza meyeriana var. granulata]